MKKISDQTSLFKLDLHDSKYEDARRKVINFIEDHWDDESELEIITGNSMKMKGIVFNVLDEYKLPYQVSYINVGKIITWT